MAKVEVKQPIVEKIAEEIKDAQSVFSLTTVDLQLLRIQSFVNSLEKLV